MHQARVGVAGITQLWPHLSHFPFSILTPNNRHQLLSDSLKSAALRLTAARAEMFSLFPQLPIELRRKIWLETLGPMTLQFTIWNPEVLKQMNVTGQQLAASYGIEQSLRDDIRALQASKDYNFRMAMNPLWEPTLPDDTPPDSPETVYWDAESDVGRDNPSDSFDEAINHRVTDFSLTAENGWSAPKDGWLAEEERIDKWEYAYRFLNGFGHYGYVALPDGSSRMSYVVESTPAYRACKESRSFLAHIFAEPVREGGGLPSWFRFDIDTIRFQGDWMHRIGNHPWYLQTQHLYIDLKSSIGAYLDPARNRYDERSDYGDDDHDASIDRVEKGHDWIIQHLTQLKDLSIELRTFETRHCEDDWFGLFDSICYDEAGNFLLPFQVRVLSPRIPGSEWLTPQNYLRIQKSLYIDDLGPLYPDGKWREMLSKYSNLMETLVSATDEQLSDPAAFHAKHLSTWRSFRGHRFRASSDTDV